MKLFKKFFTKISDIGKKIYNSRGFEIAAFAYESVTKTVDWARLTAEFVDQMKLVCQSLMIVGKYLIKNITRFVSKTASRVKKTAQ